MSKLTLARLLAAMVALVVTAFIPQAASARWLMARTPHFEVYSDGDETALRDYASKLEIFDAVLRSQHGVSGKGETPRRLKIYLVRSHADLEKVMPGAPEELAGFYSAGTDDIFAIGLRGRLSDSEADDTMLHEYVHHFMLQNFAYPYAAWLVEGYAEYYMTTKILDRRIDIGNVNKNRAEWLVTAKWIPLDDLLTKRSDEIGGEAHFNYYPQAWLLTHYMLSDQTRRRQLVEYMKAVGAGQGSVAAFTAATGKTIPQLTEDLRRYMGSALTGTRLNLSNAIKVDLTVTPLPASADDLLLDRQRMGRMAYRGTDTPDDPEEAKARAKAVADDEAFLANVRRKAALHPGDRLADLTLAEAEIRLGDKAKAETILKRLLAANGDDVDALYLSGYSRLRAGIEDSEHRAEHYAEAGPFFAKAFKLDPDNYQVLYAYAQTRTTERGYPSENTLNSLELAHQLAPQVDEITVNTARAMIIRGEKPQARALLTIVANNPHGGGAARQAQAMLKGLN